MAPPAIALRFRDSTFGIDTIAEHRAIIQDKGFVGWGWWKKLFEPIEPERIFSSIAKEQTLDVVLIDRSTKRAFISCCVGFVGPDDADPNLVPEYYKDNIREIAGLFILKSIDDTDYDEALAEAIQEQTFLWVGDVADPSLGHVATATDAPGRSCVLHISDLHFGKDYGFKLQDEDFEIGDCRRTLAECIVADLERLEMLNEIAAVIVTGDFMTHGVWQSEPRSAALAEFEALRARLDLKREQIVALPGNHDVVRYPDTANIDLRENVVDKQATYEHETMFRKFVEELVGRNWSASLNYVRRIHLGEVDLDICVLNSCTIAATQWTEYGYIGRNGLDAIGDLGKQSIERPTFRFLALHHHLLPVASVEAPRSKGVTMTLDASEILAAAQRSGVHVALHGHQHKPKIAIYQNVGLNGEASGDPVHVIANGSAGAKSDRLPPGERNTYCLFRLRSDTIEVWIRELRVDGVAGAQVFHGSLAVAPANL